MTAHQITFDRGDIRDHLKFGPASRVLVFGSSGAGKSTYINSLLSDVDAYFANPIKRILYFHTSLRDNTMLLDPKIELRTDDPINIVRELESGSSLDDSLVVLDDALQHAKNNAITTLFNRLSNHHRVTVLLVTQAAFGGPVLRSVLQNSTDLILFRHSTDPASISILSSRLFPSKPAFLGDALRQIASETPFSPLHIRTRANFGIDQLRVFSGFLKGTNPESSSFVFSCL